MVVRWEHQRRIASRIKSQGSLLVGADMGTGKSLAAIDGVVDDDFVMVICPVAVGPAWLKQFGIYDDGRATFAAFDGPSNRRIKAVAGAIEAGGRRALITNYDWFWRDQPMKALLAAAKAGRCPSAIIADECHRAKSPSSRASRALHLLGRHCRGAKRVAMTGTPMPLGPQDIYGQARFVDDSVFGTSHRSFLSQFFVTDPMYPSRVVGRRNQDEFVRRLNSIMFRVTADEVLDLPPAIHEQIPVALSPEVRRTYTSVEHALAVEVQGGTVDLQNGMVKLLRLQQATSSHIGTDAGVRVLEPISGKARAIEEWLSDLQPGEPVAIFCKFIHDLDQIRGICNRTGRKFAELSGREKTLAEWQRGERDTIAVQIQAGGVGVDLTRCGDRPCRYVVYMSVGFSLADYEQSLARVRRPGQTAECVRYYHVVVNESIDETVYAALAKKRDVVEDVLTRLREVANAT